MKIIVSLFPVTLFIIFLFIKLLSPDTYRLLIEEDSFVEYIQSLFFFLSSTFSFFVSIKFFKNKLVLHGVLYCILSIGLFFISLEEISWGQRIFNIANPSYFEQHNWQHEISLHNLDIFRLSLLNAIYIVIGAYGTFAWLILRPFMTRLKTKRENVINFIVPEWPISSYFFFVFFIYMLLSFIKQYPGGFLVWQDQEPAELLLSIGFLLFTVHNYIKLKTFQETTDSFQHCIKTNFEMKRLSARQFFITLVPSTSVLGVLIAVYIFFEIQMPLLTQDVAYIAKIHPLFGILSSLGIILWCVTAAVCFFAAIMLRKIETREKFYFLFFSALLTSYLLLDDFFQVHEYLAPKYLGLNETLILILLGVSTSAYLFAFRKIIFNTNFIFLALAITFFAISVFIDEILHSALSQLMGYDWKCFFEDGSKWLGIACWCSYFTSTSYQLLINALRMDDRSGQSELLHSKSTISNQSEVSAASGEIPVKLIAIWNRHKALMIGLTVVIGVIALMFAIFKNTDMNKNAKQLTDIESTRSVTPAPDEAGSVSDLLSNALAFCSGERCTNPKKSIEYLNEAIRRQPDFTDAFFIRGNVYAQRGMYQKAINDYNEVIRLNPDDTRPYGNRGTVYLMMGEKTSGCADTQKACERGNCNALDWAKRKGLCR